MFTLKIKLKEKQGVFLRIALIALLIWFLISVLQLRIEIGDKQAVLAELTAQINTQQRINEELEGENANDDLYLEQHARDNGLAKPGESIYKEVPGN